MHICVSSSPLTKSDIRPAVCFHTFLMFQTHSFVSSFQLVAYSLFSTLLSLCHVCHPVVHFAWFHLPLVIHCDGF